MTALRVALPPLRSAMAARVAWGGDTAAPPAFAKAARAGPATGKFAKAQKRHAMLADQLRRARAARIGAESVLAEAESAAAGRPVSATQPERPAAEVLLPPRAKSTLPPEDGGGGGGAPRSCWRQAKLLASGCWRQAKLLGVRRSC